MKTIPTYFISALAVLLLFINADNAQAQTQNIACTGFNADVVANGVGLASTSTNSDIDGASYVFIDNTFKATGSCAVQTSNVWTTSLASTGASGLTYNLKAANTNNDLRLTSGDVGKLTVTTPLSISKLYFLASGGWGSCPTTVTVHFTDNSSETFTGITVPDWCAGTGAVSPQLYRTTRESSSCTYSLCPYMYELSVTLSAINQYRKVASVDFENGIGVGVLNVFAIAGVATTPPACTAPTSQPTSLSLVPSPSYVTGSFTAASGSDSYLILRGTSSAVSTAPTNGVIYSPGNTIGTKTVVSFQSGTSFTDIGLAPGTIYYYFIYSANANCSAGPIYNTVLPLKNASTTTSTTSATFTTSSTWTCPAGVTSVTVDAWGGGGGGGSTNGGGGGGGAYVRNTTVSVTPGTEYDVTIGQYGLAGLPSINSGKGGDGENTVFGTTLVTANGGKGGNGGPSGAAGNGGAAGTYKGGKGAAGNTTRGGGGGGGAGTSNAGRNATNEFGGTLRANYGGKGGDGTSTGNGQNATYNTSNYGGGGGGGNNNGGVGASGLMIITCNSCPVFTPTFSDAPTTTTCVGVNVTYMTQMGQTNYAWSVPGVSGVDYSLVSGGLAGTNYFVTLKWLTTGSKTVTVSYMVDACPSTGSATSTTTVYSNPTATITPASPATCIGAGLALTATPAGGSAVYSLHSWTGAGASSLSSTSATNPTFTSGTAGSYALTYTVTDDKGCVGSDSKTVTVNAAPTPTFTTAPAASLCVGASATYTTQSGKTNYTWSVPGTAGINYTITSGGIGTTSNTVTLTWLTAGSKTVTVNYSQSGCVGASAASSISTVYALPIVSTNISGSSPCISGSVTIDASSSVLGTTFNWYDAPSAGTLLYTGASYTSPSLTSTTSYYVSGTANGCLSASRETATAVVSPAVSTWTGAVDNNWNNAANWSNGLPCSGSKIIIGDVTTAANYPVITSTTYCDTIVFEDRGALKGLEYLEYNKAFVKMTLARNRWYTVTTPLKELSSGDYYFDGSPITYMRLFDDINPDAGDMAVGTWTRTFASLSVPLSTGYGFAFKIDSIGWDRSGANPIKASSQSNMSLTFPKTNNDGSLIRTATPYSGLNGKLNPYKAVTLAKDSLKAYRFAMEDASNNLPTSISVTVKPGLNLIGNPLMTHLDFAAFQASNAGKISNKVKFWNGTSFDGYVLLDGGVLSTAMGSGASIVIPPMQAFFVECTTGAATDVDFYTASHFVEDQTTTLRSCRVPKNIMHIQAQNNVASTSICIAKNDDATNGFGNDDDFKLFSQFPNVPEVYTISSGKAVGINQFSEYPFTTPLSLKCATAGTIKLKFEGINSFDPEVNVELINSRTGERIDLKETNNYDFEYDGTNASGELFVSFRTASVSTDITSSQNESVQIFSDAGTINVISSPDDLIQEVEILNTDGRQVFKESGINKVDFKKSAEHSNTFYIVKVSTKSKCETKKIMVK